MTSDYDRSSASLVVMNPRSGGGKVTRFRLVERAEALGARVLLTGPAQDPGSLARRGVEEGAEVLGVAGGDGTISAVAAVAADTGCPLVVIPAGTRNHFARDLGLDPSDPGVALHAVVDGQSVRVDLGRVGSRVFVNNVSFGMYADALLEPGYREAKGRTLAAVAPRYLDGRQAVPATVDIPGGAVDQPQLVLVSNNPYHLSTPRGFGRRPSLATGLLGGIVAKRPPGPPPPDLLQRLRRDLQGRGGPSDEGVIAWSAASVTLAGTTPRLPVGIDGESVLLDLPVTCATWPGALRVLLPRG